MPPKSRPDPHPNSPTSSVKPAYLLLYNLVSAVLWLAVLGQVALVGSSKGFESGNVYQETERFCRLTQTLAGLEIIHSLIGIVRAPLLTTLMQVSSRFLLVWGIAYQFPQTTKFSPAYSSMLTAWSVTEVVRYSYFVFVLAGTGVPSVLSWLRYNTFLILYPIGVGSETWLIYKAISPASKQNPAYGYALYAVLAIYIPGFYTLFTHMLKQRRRIIASRAA